MSRKDALIKLRQVLVHRRDAIRRVLEGDLTALAELSMASGDLADAALDSAHEEVTSQMAEVEGRELVQIEEALQRFEEGTYGECVDCEKPVPLARLQALPYARCCINCQRASEKMNGSAWSGRSGHAYDSGIAAGDTF
ncbi:MAG: TraR/DksA family transcriptional regulator [Pirellulales bacterium]